MKVHKVVFMVQSLIILAIAGSALIGYLSNTPYLTRWGVNISMAPNTAVCFLLVVANFILISMEE